MFEVGLDLGDGGGAGDGVEEVEEDGVVGRGVHLALTFGRWKRRGLYSRGSWGFNITLRS